MQLPRHAGTLKVIMRCVKWNSASRSSWIVTMLTPKVEVRHQGFRLLVGSGPAQFMSTHNLTILRLPPGCSALWCKAGDYILDAMAVRVVWREGPPGITQEALLLILGWVMGSKSVP